VDFLKINREVTIQTVFRYANDYPKTISMISKGVFDVENIADRYFEYENTQEAFEFSVNNKQELIKGVIRVSKDMN
jgi:L-iditol 2-dehydrogenase